jgi:hypothetical protein
VTLTARRLDTFAEWRDRIAWGIIVGIVSCLLAWAAWLTDRSYHTPTTNDFDKLSEAINSTRNTIHELDKTVVRLTDRIDHLSRPTHP